jgi:predicted lipid-binding transport protein (Tim44 family)
MTKPVLLIVAAATLAGCGITIDFGPEPGTPGDPNFEQFQPQLHGPGAPPRNVDANGRPLEPAVAPADAPAPAAAPVEATTPSIAPAPSSVAPAAPAAGTVMPAPAPVMPASPAPTSEAMFNDAIVRAVETGDIDRALRLLEEAERLGSSSARPTFIEALEKRSR